MVQAAFCTINVQTALQHRPAATIKECDCHLHHVHLEMVVPVRHISWWVVLLPANVFAVIVIRIPAQVAHPATAIHQHHTHLWQLIHTPLAWGKAHTIITQRVDIAKTTIILKWAIAMHAPIAGTAIPQHQPKAKRHVIKKAVLHSATKKAAEHAVVRCIG